MPEALPAALARIFTLKEMMYPIAKAGIPRIKDGEPEGRGALRTEWREYCCEFDYSVNAAKQTGSFIQWLNSKFLTPAQWQAMQNVEAAYVGDPLGEHDPTTWNFLQLLAAVTEGGDDPEGVYLENHAYRLGDQGYRIGNNVPFVIAETWDIVLRSLIKLGGVATITQLRNESNLDDVGRILKNIQEKFPELRQFIVLPGGKGEGGYRTTIIDAAR